MRGPKKVLREECLILNADRLGPAIKRSGLSRGLRFAAKHSGSGAELTTLWEVYAYSPKILFWLSYEWSGQRLKYRMEAVWQQQSFGSRFLLKCPAQGCGRRSRKLYLPCRAGYRYFGCRRCNHLEYMSHRRPWLAPLETLIKILSEAGDLQEAKGRMRDFLESARHELV